jgi:hypothetical protein
MSKTFGLATPATARSQQSAKQPLAVSRMNSRLRFTRTSCRNGFARQASGPFPRRIENVVEHFALRPSSASERVPRASPRRQNRSMNPRIERGSPSMPSCPEPMRVSHQLLDSSPTELRLRKHRQIAVAQFSRARIGERLPPRTEVNDQNIRWITTWTRRVSTWTGGQGRGRSTRGQKTPGLSPSSP